MQQPSGNESIDFDELDQWVTPQGFVDDYPQFTASQISWVIRQRKVNGLERVGAVTLFGRKHYLNKRLFTDWFHSRGR